MTFTFEFEYEVEALGMTLTVEATVTPSPPHHCHPGDPDNTGECEITNVTHGTSEIDPDAIKVAWKKLIWPLLGPARRVPEWFILTDLLREAAWEQAEREAA